MQSLACPRTSVGICTVHRNVAVAARRQAQQGGAQDPDTIKYGQKLSNTGYIAEDNSGRGNIFGTEPKQLYTKSPTADKAASQGIGGIAGLGIVLAIIAAVAVATSGSATYDTTKALEATQEANADVESISAIADRFR